MAGPGGQVHKGWRRHMRWARETDWGRPPDSPSWVCIPIQAGRMNLRSTASLFAPETGFGGWRRSPLLPESLEVAGRVEVLAWPEVTEYLLDAVLERDLDPASASYQDLHSYCIDYFTPPDPRRYLGAKAERLEIFTDSQGLALALWLRAWKEEPNDSLSEDQFDYAGLTPGPFRLSHAAITLNGENILDLEHFAIRVDNDLAAGPNEAGRVACLVAGSRAVRLELLKLDISDVLNDAVRAGSPLSFAAEFAHPGGDGLTLELPALYAVENAEKAPPHRVARSRAVLEATTDESGRDLIYTVGPLVTTTTTAP